MRFASKQELIESIEREHDTLAGLLATVPRSRYREAGVWGDGWSIQDLLAHLTAWERMFMRWFEEGRDGGSPDMPAPGYMWSQTPALNRAIRSEHAEEPLARTLGEFEASYRAILSFARRMSAEELLTPGHFAWTGKYPLTTYLAPNTCSHYRFAIRVLKRWLKTQDH